MANGKVDGPAAQPWVALPEHAGSMELIGQDYCASSIAKLMTSGSSQVDASPHLLARAEYKSEGGILS